MNLHTIVALYKPIDENSWYLLETDKNCYELKPGVMEKASISKGREALDLPVKGREIQRIRTDNSALFMELDNDEYLVHVETSIDNKGNTIFNMDVWTKKEFDTEMENYLDEDDKLIEILF